MGQPLSLIWEYDLGLGGGGDLFKAPEPIIIEEPPLLLPAAINVGVGLIEEVLYECEKELMEKSVIEETISNLLDVHNSMLRVQEEEEVPLAGELHQNPTSGCLNSAADWMNGKSVRVRPNFLDFQGLDLEAAFQVEEVPAGELHESPTSGCLNSAADWMNGKSVRVRPNFLDFQGLDLEAAFQNHGANTPRPGNSGNVHKYCDLKAEERKQKLSRYRMKKIKRNFGRKIEYACRKALADRQPRVRGRFSKMVGGDILKPKWK